MDMDFITMFFSIMGFVMISLLGGNVFFIKKLITSVDVLQNTINDHKVLIETEKTKSASFEKSCALTHDTVTKRLDNHSIKLAEHEQSIAILKERIR